MSPLRYHHNFLFDLDQTLLDFHASEKKALGIVLQKNALPFSDEIYDSFKAYNKSLWLDLEKGIISRKELFTMRFSYIIGKCGGDITVIDPLSVNDDFIYTMSVNGVPMRGSLEFVSRIKREIEEARIYIITNGVTVNAMGRIRSTGLDDYIDDIFVSQDMGVQKPDPAYFDMVLQKIGEPKESCIVIGDSLSSDMLGAKNASMTSIWFMPQGDVAEAVRTYDIDHCASDYDELFDILKKLAG